MTAGLLGDAWLWGLIVLGGLALGSFASAVAWRLPRGVSFVRGRSACRSCQTPLAARDLVPILSWLWTRGRCRYCQEPQGLRYPLIEAATLALCLFAAGRFGIDVTLIPLMLLAAVSVAIIDIDLRLKIIPNQLNFAIALLGLVYGLLVHAPLWSLVMAAVIYGLGALALRQIFLGITKREALGLGDVKFFAASGFWLGLSGDAAALYLIGAGASGVILAILWQRVTKEKEFPFGPALIVGMWLALAV